jgi:hypothetical protein
MGEQHSIYIHNKIKMMEKEIHGDAKRAYAVDGR